MTGPEQMTLDGSSMPLRQVGGITARRPPLGVTVFDDSLARALDNAGVAPGEAFYVSAVPPVSALEGDGQARVTDPATSKAAAKDPGAKRGTLRAAVLLALRDGPAASDRLERLTGIEYRSLSPRVGELKKWGYVRDTGRTMKGRRGSDQQVVVLTDKGVAMVDQLGREEMEARR